VTADGEARVVTWSHPPVGSTDVFYRVFRTPLDGTELDCLDHRGAAECQLEMDVIGTTREPRWRDGSPPPNVRYRIGVAANWRDDPDEGDVATLSRPVPAG
jgi:hypothetical protein